MPAFTRTNGNVQVYGAVGRDITLTSFSKTNMTQAELNTIVNEIQKTSSVVAIGSDQASGAPFVSGTSDVVHIITEGPAPTVGSNYGGVTGCTSALVSRFFA